MPRYLGRRHLTRRSGSLAQAISMNSQALITRTWRDIIDCIFDISLNFYMLLNTMKATLAFHILVVTSLPVHLCVSIMFPRYVKKTALHLDLSRNSCSVIEM